MRWKKMVSALLIGAMVCTMGACGSSGSKDSTQGGSKTSSKGDILINDKQCPPTVVFHRRVGILHF